MPRVVCGPGATPSPRQLWRGNGTARSGGHGRHAAVAMSSNHPPHHPRAQLLSLLPSPRRPGCRFSSSPGQWGPDPAGERSPLSAPPVSTPGTSVWLWANKSRVNSVDSLANPITNPLWNQWFNNIDRLFWEWCEHSFPPVSWVLPVHAPFASLHHSDKRECSLSCSEKSNMQI